MIKICLSGCLWMKKDWKQNVSRLQQELDGAAIVSELFWNYSFFEKIIKGVLTRMGLMHSDNLGPQASPKTQIAVTCEVRATADLQSSCRNPQLGWILFLFKCLFWFIAEHVSVPLQATSRLSALDTQPMNRMLAYGARYLQTYHSSWAKQQGGYVRKIHTS